MCLSCSFNSALPNLTALIRRPHHRIAFFALIGLREGRHVRQRTVDAKARERMRVGGVSQTRGFGANVLGPNLRPAKEKALFGSEAVDVLWPRFALQRFLISIVRDRQTAEIRYRFCH